MATLDSTRRMSEWIGHRPYSGIGALCLCPSRRRSWTVGRRFPLELRTGSVRRPPLFLSPSFAQLQHPFRRRIRHVLLNLRIVNPTDHVSTSNPAHLPAESHIRLVRGRDRWRAGPESAYGRSDMAVFHRITLFVYILQHILGQHQRKSNALSPSQ